MKISCRFLFLLFLGWASLSTADNVIKGPMVGVTYNGLHATAQPSASTVDQELRTISESFDYVRTYYPQYGGGNVRLIDLAKGKIKLLVGLYMFDNQQWTNDDYKNYLKPALQNNADQAITGVLVGNENPGKADEILTLIKQIKSDAPTIPVSSAQTNADWLGDFGQRLVGQVDFIAANIYPSWCWTRSTPNHIPAAKCGAEQAITPEEAFNSFKQQFDELQAKYPNKQIVVTETGYPTNFGQEVASSDTSTAKLYACQYLKHVSQWAKAKNQLVYMYEMFDSQEGINSSSGFNYHFGLNGKFALPNFKQGNFPEVSCP